MPATIGERGMTRKEFRRIRNKLGLSINECAEILSVASGRTIRRWENGDLIIPYSRADYMERLDDGRIRLDDVQAH